MRKIIFKALPLFFASVLILSGCSISLNTGGSTTTSSKDDGGIYKSENKGNTWKQSSLIAVTSGRPKSFAGIDMTAMVLDPSDSKAIYAGSTGNGLLYSYDSANNWQIAKNLGQVTVNSIAVDTGSKCIIYASSGNKLYKSSDCSRTWEQTYFDNDPKIMVTAVAVDPANGAVIYIGTTRGEIIRSLDRGISWKTLNRFENTVRKIIISPSNQKVIFVGTDSKGIFRSLDGGENWADLSDNMKDFNDDSRFRDMVISDADPDIIFLATQYGLIKSTDNGNTWHKIELITPEEKATINAVAINPKNNKEIYYVTNTTFYRSLDGGSNWTSKKLPTNRAGWKLAIDPDNPSVIYLAARKTK